MNGDQVYPDGPWRPPSSVQRGSGQFLSLCAGDPFRADARYLDTTTEVLRPATPLFRHPVTITPPYVNLYPSAARFQDLCGYTPEETIPAIPMLPISYGDAAPLLALLGGAPAPER